jgi:transcriptional regulator with XRE-family HTH domain
MYGAWMNLTDFGDLDGRVAFGHDDLHVIQYPTNWEISKGLSTKNREIAEIATNTQTYRMARPKKSREEDPWKQRDRFMALVDQKLAEGVPLVEIAHKLGLRTTDSLESKYRYDHSRVPKRSTIKLAAEYFKVLESEIYGDEVSEADRARAFLVSGGMGSDEVNSLTDKQVNDAMRVALATAKAMLAK